MTGIYKIQSKVKPERIYVGSSVDIDHRWAQHRNRILSKNSHHPKLTCHVKKYGVDDLEFSVIEQFEFTTKEYLLSREQFYIDTLIPWFNTCPMAKSSLGSKRSEETRKKISENSKGNKNMLGKHLSKEVRQILSEAHKGKKTGRDNPFYGKHHSEETKKKISDINKGHESWNKGIPCSEETKRKLSKAGMGKKNKLGKYPSIESRKKMSEAKLGKCLSDETKKNMSEAQKRRGPRSEETKRKMSKSAKGNKYALGCIRSKEYKQKISERNKHLGLTPPSRLGIRYTEEQKRIKREKMRATLLRKKQNTDNKCNSLSI